MEIEKQNNFKKPKLSIITVCYNAESTITETIDSVLKYANEGIEYVIIDGNSKDETLSIIEKYRGVFNNRKITFKFVSESDKGIYDAMNKGILHSSGDWIMFLNSGDLLIEQIDISLLKKETIYCYGFYFYFIYNNNKYRKAQYPQISKFDLPTCHNAMIFPKTNIQYDLKYKISADYDFYNKYLKSGFDVSFVTNKIIEYSRDGVSEVYLIPTLKEKFLINVSKNKRLKVAIYLFVLYLKEIFLTAIKKAVPKTTIIKRRLKSGYNKI